MIELGKKIQEKRMNDSLTIDNISSQLNIRPEFIIAIEKGNVNSFSSEAYYYGYLKQYLKLLKLNNLDINLSTPVASNLVINEPIRENFKPSFLFIIIALSLSIIVYKICDDFINSNAIDPIALDFKNHITKLAQID